MTKIEYTPLDLESIKEYKKNNPSKFAHKFGDLDLDNLPKGFDMAKHRRMIRKQLPKTPLLDEYMDDDEDDENYTYPSTTPKEKVSTVEDEEEIEESANDEGGETLNENNQ